MPTIPVYYRVVTDSERGEAARKFAAPLRTRLLSLGFASLGVLQTRSPGSVDQYVFRRYLQPDDAELLIENAEQGALAEVFTSPDRQVFASIENVFGEALVMLYTLLDNGMVIETSMKPGRGVAYKPGVSGRLMNLANRRIQPWERETVPASGYFVEQVDTRDPDWLWQRHRQRVGEMQAKFAAEIRATPQADASVEPVETNGQPGQSGFRQAQPANLPDIRLYAAIAQRSTRITTERVQAGSRLLNMLTFATMLLVWAGVCGVMAVFIFLTAQVQADPAASAQAETVKMAVPFVCVPGLVLLLGGMAFGVVPNIHKFVPGPRPESVEMMLRRVKFE
jgi:hypothetical protein